MQARVCIEGASICVTILSVPPIVCLNTKVIVCVMYSFGQVTIAMKRQVANSCLHTPLCTSETGAIATGKHNVTASSADVCVASTGVSKIDFRATPKEKGQVSQSNRRRLGSSAVQPPVSRAYKTNNVSEVLASAILEKR